MVYQNYELDAMLRGRKVKKLIDQLYKDLRKRYDLKQVEVDVLIYKTAYPDKSSSEIAEDLSIQRGHVSLAMDGLCGKGYMEAKRNAADKRFIDFSVTDEGKRINDELQEIRDGINEKIFRGFTEEDLSVLCSLGARIMENVESISCEKDK